MKRLFAAMHVVLNASTFDCVGLIAAGLFVTPHRLLRSI